MVEALVPTMQDAEVPAPLRRQAGLLLGRLGWLPDDLDAFVEVPAGEFLYGDDRKKREIPYRYWIGKYPVTNAQYARFIGDGGYERQEWWSADGWRWRNGVDSDLTVIEDEKLRQLYRDWLARRPSEKRGQPFWWDDPERNNPLFPVVGVGWFEAEAYAAWLNSRAATLDLGEAVPADYRVRLPSEEEWERAARGTDGREYPWPGDFDTTRANVASEIGRGTGATAVCTYPQGLSPTGAWDMSGNVWEWTGDLWSADGTIPGVAWRVVGTPVRGAPAARTATGTYLTTSATDHRFSGGCVPIEFWLLISGFC